MSTALPLQNMSTQDKLRIMEQIWEDLSKTPSDIPFPVWHGEELKAREERLKQRLTHFSDWAEAKERIRRRIA